MSAVRELRGLRLVRPLLGAARARLAALLDGEGQAYLRDPSNRDPAFERARLRLSPRAEIEAGAGRGRRRRGSAARAPRERTLAALLARAVRAAPRRVRADRPAAGYRRRRARRAGARPARRRVGGGRRRRGLSAAARAAGAAARGPCRRAAARAAPSAAAASCRGAAGCWCCAKPRAAEPPLAPRARRRLHCGTAASPSACRRPRRRALNARLSRLPMALLRSAMTRSPPTIRCRVCMLSARCRSCARRGRGSWRCRISVMRRATAAGGCRQLVVSAGGSADRSRVYSCLIAEAHLMFRWRREVAAAALASISAVVERGRERPAA